MGEEEAKKPQESAKKVEEEKKEEAPKVEKAPAAEEKKEDKKPEEPKAASEQAPPPQEIVLKVYMHCEGCARKVRRCLKGFEGVEEVKTDCRSSKVVVKGEKADPLKVLERVQKKSHGLVELISPIPKPVEAKKPEEKEVVKVEEKKEELPVITVVLAVYMHCEACAQEIRKRIQKMKGVEIVEPDLKNSQVVVKGVFEPEKLADYIHKRTGKHAVIVKIEPEKKEEAKKEGKEEKKPEEGANKEAKKGEESAKETNPAVTTDGVEPPAPAPVVAEAEAEADGSKLEMKRNESYYYQYQQNYQLYPQIHVHELHTYPPQMFSDENPNACSVM
ncbi:neurofilament medium polypeptide-like [Dorcoceras hygrometricum]|uniref:Neurofilament medium polypeptide-like n=1 Tax=Dorcoceras hygrometricum TaxID=472368 RepID=A0A2Z7CBY8_9LAMI|nr:neurofilament medium polypeptide-like [Dorcoceras hygrometricum]